MLVLCYPVSSDTCADTCADCWMSTLPDILLKLLNVPHAAVCGATHANHQEPPGERTPGEQGEKGEQGPEGPKGEQGAQGKLSLFS